MSTENAHLETPKSQKSLETKDKSGKKSSKKRSHEDQTQPADADAALEASSPSKKQRIEASNPTIEITDTTPPHSQSLRPWQADAKLLETHTPFIQQTTSLYLPLSPVAHSFALAGLCAEHLSPLLMTYYPPLHGVLLSYTNPRLSESPHNVPSSIPPSHGGSDADDEASTATPSTPTVLAKAIDEYATSFIWLTADFTLLRPEKGTWIEGFVNLQNESYLGIICYNYFNAGIDVRRLPKDWVWVSAQQQEQQTQGDEQGAQETGDGWFVDAEGLKVEGVIRFRVRDFEAAPATERERGFVSIEGTLLDEAEDEKLDEQIRERLKGHKKGTKLGRMAGSAAGAHDRWKNEKDEQ